MQVAVKRLKNAFPTWESCLAHPEVRALQQLSHPHIIKLREVLRENCRLYFVFEHMSQSLRDLAENRPLPERAALRITFALSAPFFSC